MYNTAPLKTNCLPVVLSYYVHCECESLKEPYRDGGKMLFYERIKVLITPCPETIRIVFSYDSKF